MDSNVNNISGLASQTVLPSTKALDNESVQSVASADKIESARKSLEKNQEQARQLVVDREPEHDETSVVDVVKSINQILESQDRDVKFVVDERDGELVTSILNRSTDELIREIPTEEYRQLGERLKNFQDAIGKTTGLFVDQLV